MPFNTNGTLDSALYFRRNDHDKLFGWQAAQAMVVRSATEPWRKVEHFCSGPSHRAGWPIRWPCPQAAGGL